MANIVYIAASVDGFIATSDGKVDWLYEIPNPTGSDYGFSDFMERVDGIIMGRKTFDTVSSFDPWPYSKKVFVLSRSLQTVEPRLAENVELVSGNIDDVVNGLKARGYENLYIDGGNVIQEFLNEGLIDELIITKIPIILGGGIPLFSEKGPKINLVHCSTEVYDGGQVKSHYKVDKAS